VARAFTEAGERGWASALIPFVCAGDPDLLSTEACLTGFPEAGASIVEVGIPFSDPIADGPTIASAMHRALTSGVTVHEVLECVARARAKTDAPFVAMVSCSIAQKYGADRFAEMLAGAGFDGVIYPDVPLEEAPAFTGPARSAGLSVSLLVSPATPEARASEIARASDGFVYAMARTGITGAGASGDGAARAAYLERLRGASETAVGCGFGISTPEDVRAVAPHADGVIVGSAIVKAMHDAHASGGDPVEAAVELVRRLSDAAHG
jgi:tryptophan synthase alpha chain